MRKILSYIIIITSFFTFVQLQAQKIERIIQIDQLGVTKENGQAIIKLNINLDSLDIRTVEMITLTPKIESEDNLVIKTFSPIVIVGGNREKMLKRSIKLNDFEFDNTPLAIVKHRNNHKQSIPLVLELPYEKELHNAKLVFDEEINGCACNNDGEDKILIMNPIFPAIYNPTYKICYITPPVEKVKARSDKYAAHLNFKVGKYDLLYDFGDNAKILEEVNGIITEIRSDPNLEVTDIQVTGYASPEGNYDSNMTLSKNRAYAFVQYLVNKYNIHSGMIKTDWKGEEWDGLREMVNNSSIIDKDKILYIIDNEKNIAQRKIELKKLSGGKTYKVLLEEIYPSLRRNEYRISYITRPFTVEEAAKIIKRKPQYLSLNEMFMVANMYPKNSQEFKEVFDIMEKFYPNNPIVKANIAAANLEYGNWDIAIEQYESIKEKMPEIWNNLGYAYFQKKDYKKAEECFRKASETNLNCAITNISEFEKWRITVPE